MSLMKLSHTHTHLWVTGSFLIYGAIKSLWSTAYGWQFAFHLMTMKSGVWKILQWSTCFSTPSLVIFNHTSWLPTSASPQGLGKKDSVLWKQPTLEAAAAALFRPCNPGSLCFISALLSTWFYSLLTPHSEQRPPPRSHSLVLHHFILLMPADRTGS